MSDDDDRAEVIIIGGGIVGAGAACEISKFARVLILEAEDTCGYHATGRSVASFTENYGTGVIRRLAMASRDFLTAPPEGFVEAPILGPRGMITVARADQKDLIDFELDRARALVPSIHALTVDEAIARVPVLRRDYLAHAIFEPHSMDVDVHLLHQGYLRAARSRGARVLTSAAVTGLVRIGDDWQVETRKGTFRAPRVVNAAGAWADRVADLAGVRRLGLQPLRRTVFNIPAPENSAAWPLINDVGEEFFFKPLSGQIMVSPADATPSDPMDAWADEMDIAIAAERLERATTITVQRVTHSWGGLRTFAPDGSPVAGEAPDAPGFFWLAGQGGYGIKTSPALSAAIAALVRGAALPETLQAQGISADDLTPARFLVPALTDEERP
ncbi:FAD-binding oxidoreductase [Frigidibacter sp. MR17.14]|uniref:NAD(P)/FAD-dependent oxidoreductase n=1 Tax=Frigidibacter sp. MR17.14 TaxID=3126509 RepID=UPI003012ECDB